MARNPMSPEIPFEIRDKIGELEKKLHKAMAETLKPIIFDKTKFVYVLIYDRDVHYITYCRDDMVFGRDNENRFSVCLRDVKTDKTYWFKYETPEEIWRAIEDRFDYAQAFYKQIG